jgi:cytochrome d ubiquinol oxidase subunit I
MTGGAFVAGVAMWRLLRHPDVDRAAYRTAAKLGAWMLVVSGLLVVVTGDVQARIMTDVQPMKMAAAEALWETTDAAGLSLFTIGTLDGSEEIFSIRVPYLLSFMATGDPLGTVEGINNLQAQYEEQFGPGDWTPNVPVAYWGFRLMIGAGALAALAAVWLLWRMRKDRMPSRLMVATAILLPFLPLAANSIGWIFTEMGRQPWIVWGLLTTPLGVSPSNPWYTVAITLLGFTIVYGVLAIVEVGLLLRQIRLGLPEADANAGVHGEGEPSLGLGY